MSPIYNALDHHQYQRAIKLCLQQPADNLHVQALLAHAYAKSDQRPKALQVLTNLLFQNVDDAISGREDYICELRIENKYAQIGNTAQTTSAATAATSAAAASAPSDASSRSTKTGKKGKKKPATAVAKTATTKAIIAANANAVATNWDWIDNLDTPPQLPAKHFATLPPLPIPPALADGHLLSNIAVTLSFLRLTLAAYQVQAWWAAALTTSNSSALIPADLTVQDILDYLRDTFQTGLAVWMAPQYQYLPVRQTILPHLQGLAMQIVRYETELGNRNPPATLWAIQTALWQCQTDNDEEATTAGGDSTKLALLPRLAENMAAKVVREPVVSLKEGEEPSRRTVEGVLLWLQALEIQGKWQDYVDAVQELLDRTAQHPVMGLTPAMLLDYKSKALGQLGLVEAARQAAAQCLREQNPDQWDMWVRHLDNDDTENYQATVALAKELSIEKIVSSEPQQQQYPRRGPPLAILEALRRRVEKSPDDATLMNELVQQVQSYGDAFAARTACAFADLTACFGYICQYGKSENIESLLTWLQTMQVRPSADESSQRRAQLRAYIFAQQSALKLLHHFPDLQKEWLPRWKDLVRAWKDFQSFEDKFITAQTEEERKNSQKESRLADEVILLAVQLLLTQNSTTQGLVLSATLLEKAIEQSPYSAYLKLCQIFVCADLNAVSRSWSLFRELFIKHIQHESCAYLILPLLRAGGMYHEVIKVCKEMIRLQIAAVHDANDYTGKALGHGTLSRADEFIRFQRERMNKSLSTLEAKGLIMDCAPFFKQDERQPEIGSMHGIVGGENDVERIEKMISEAYNPQGAVSLLRLRGSVKENLTRVSENRDLNALAYQVFRFQNFSTSEGVLCDCIRRSRIHNLLLRAGLCVDATKGPKKGKVVKTGEELAKRCKSLIEHVKEAEYFAETEIKEPAGYSSSIISMTKLCRAIAVLSGGFVDSEPVPQDSVNFREEQTATYLQEAVAKLNLAREQLDLSASVAGTGLALPDVILPVLTLLQMCAKINDIYGWTKKRRTIRKCAGCLYDFALALRHILDDMEKSIGKVHMDPSSFSIASILKEGIVPEIISDDDIGETLFLVHGAQEQTKLRIERILTSMRNDLASFDAEETNNDN